MKHLLSGGPLRAGRARRPWRETHVARACLTLALLAFVGARAPVQPIHLVFLHTNDVHGQAKTRKATWLDKEAPPDIGGLARLAAKVVELRTLEPEAVVVDAGDWYQGTPEGALDRGLPFVQALALVGYDAMCVGNHEFDHGVENAERLVTEAKVPAILANVRKAEDKPPLAWVEPWILVERAGVRIALVGLLTTETPEITSPDVRGYYFAPPADELVRARAELEGRADLIVPVGHISVEESREVARRSPGLPLIVSGHSHTYLKEGVREGDSLIVQAGSKASALGRVDLWLEPETFAPLRTEARLIDLLEEPSAKVQAEPRVAMVRKLTDELVVRASESMGRVVGRLEGPLDRAVQHHCSAPGSWIADALRRRMQADVGLHNRGGTRCDLVAGPVTRRDLFELLPFDNNLVAVDLTGEQLLAVARRAVEGTRHMGLDFSGLALHVRRAPEGGWTLERVRVGDRELERERTYRVATNSFLAGGGDGLVELSAGLRRREDPLLLRELMELEFARTGRVVLPVDAKQRVVEEAP